MVEEEVFGGEAEVGAAVFEGDSGKNCLSLDGGECCRAGRGDELEEKLKLSQAIVGLGQTSESATLLLLFFPFLYFSVFSSY